MVARCSRVADASALAAVAFVESGASDVTGRLAGVDLLAPPVLPVRAHERCVEEMPPRTVGRRTSRAAIDPDPDCSDIARPCRSPRGTAACAPVGAVGLRCFVPLGCLAQRSSHRDAGSTSGGCRGRDGPVLMRPEGVWYRTNRRSCERE